MSLVAWLHLSLVAWLHILLLLPTCSSAHPLYVYPRILHQDHGLGTLDISIELSNTSLVLHLTQNREMLLTNRVYTQGEDGTLQINQVPTPCQYLGRIADHPYSWVVLSTCSGLRGKLRYGTKEYHIAPVTTSRDGGDTVHSLHLLTLPPVYPNNTVLARDAPARRRSARSTIKMNNRQIMGENVQNLERRYLEVSVVVDFKLHKLLGRNVTNTTLYVYEVINSVANKFLPFNIIVGLVQLEIWSKQNKIYDGENKTRVLDEFEVHRKKFLSKSDISVLFTNSPFSGSTVGLANRGTMCDEMTSCNINYDSTSATDPLFFSTIVAHEIGHVLGLDHDEEGCGCPCDHEDNGEDNPEYCPKNQDRCIMNPNLNRDYSYWSTCSKRLLESTDTISHQCLFEMPAKVWEGPVCGDGIVEAGEECDCGSAQDCPILDPCCEVGTCQLKNTSSCFTGPCCKDCQFVKKHTVCRDSSNKECDHQETCTGTESSCPQDTYRQDGRGCEDNFDNAGFCYHGNCKTHLTQCQEIFGEHAGVAKEGCFLLNHNGSYWGNCGGLAGYRGNEKYYRKCHLDDVKCGLLQCSVPNKYLDEATTNSRKLGRRQQFNKLHGDYYCLTVQYNAPVETDEVTYQFNDFGQVQDGTPCGLNKFCKKNRCEEVTYTECPGTNGTECNGHGVCNNINQCFCEEGWDPSNNCMNKQEQDDKMGIITVLIVLVVTFPIIVGVVVYCAKHHFDLKKMAQQRNIRLSIRRLSSRARGFNRQTSRTSQKSGGGGKVRGIVTQYTRVPPTAADTKPPVMRLPPPPPPVKPVITPTRVPPPPPSKTALNKTLSPHKTLSPPIVRRLHDPYRARELDHRTHSDTFTRNTRVPLNNMGSAGPALSENSLLSKDSNPGKKASLQPPKLLAGRSRESKKLQISGPTGDVCSLKDGRPISIVSATDIKRSTDSVNTVSSTRMLFEPQKNKPRR